MADFLFHRSCPECGSSDALGVYADGGGYCFAFGCEKHWKAGTFDMENEDGEAIAPRASTGSGKSSDFITEIEYRPLEARKISRECAERYGYGFGQRYNKPVHVAPFFNAQNGKLVGQKLRKPGKNFEVIGVVSNLLFGQQIARNGGKMIVITEGELDAMSVSMAMGLAFPAVSLPNGAGAAGSVLAANMSWLDKFERIVLCFDNDEPGIEAANEAAMVFEPGRVSIAKLPLKDASDMLVAGRGDEIRVACWEAKTWRPDGIISIADFIDEACTPAEKGLPWWSQALTDLTYGRRYGELYGFGAGTGAGKTDWFTQQMVYDMEGLDEKVGIIYLEMPKREIAQRLAGKLVGKRFHVPDDGWEPKDLRMALEQIQHKAILYDNFGETDWSVIKGYIRAMHAHDGVRHFYLDHLTAMVDPRHERESLEIIMKEMAMLAKERELMIHFISHLSTPDGKSHEEGAQISGRHFKGSRAIQYWPDFLFGIERNQQAETPEERRNSYLRILKDRYTGASTGTVLPMVYDVKTGLLMEAEEALFTDKSGDF